MSSLYGQRIVVTRANSPSEPLAERLAALGAEVIALPAIRVVFTPEAIAGASLAAYDWLVVTSANAVAAIAEAGLAFPAGLRAAAVGPRTEAALRALGARDVLVPARHDAEALAVALAPLVSGGRVLWPRGDLAPDALAQSLRAAGATVDAPVVYRTEAAAGALDAFEAQLAAGRIDWVTFASGSAVRGLAAAMAEPERLRHAKLASIGPRTSAALRELGFEPTREATPSTLDGLVAAIT